MAKTSASNVAERTPIKGSKRAPSKAGAIGAALAVMILKHAEETGMAEVRERESRKQTLARLMDFPSNAEHIAFRNDLTVALEKIKTDAEKAKITMQAYREANPVANSVAVEVSLWVKMSRAVEYGFNKAVCDMTKPWPAISKAATDHLASTEQSTGDAGNGTGNKTNAGPRARRGRQATPALDKAKRFAKDVLLDEKTMAVKPDVNLAKIVGEMLLRATVAQCDEVIAECVRIRDMKANIEAELKAKTAKQSDAAKALAEEPSGDAGKSGTTHTGATVKVTKATGKRTGAPTPTVTDDKISHAQASTGRKTYDPATQSKLRDGTIVDIKPTAPRRTRKATA